MYAEFIKDNALGGDTSPTLRKLNIQAKEVYLGQKGLYKKQYQPTLKQNSSGQHENPNCFREAVLGSLQNENLTSIMT